MSRTAQYLYPLDSSVTLIQMERDKTKSNSKFANFT
jgi:hypothetical protein